jgi:hypothetical protein
VGKFGSEMIELAVFEDKADIVDGEKDKKKSNKKQVEKYPTGANGGVGLYWL